MLNSLPKLLPQDNLSVDTRHYLLRLKESAFSGDIDLSYASRLAVATDNSIYQETPQAVLFPRSIDDLQRIAKAAQNQENITFSARGGGTGTNGQSLTPGIVVDTSRYMNRIISLNIEEEWVELESGVVKDALNDYLLPHGYFFSPDLSTSNRATIGGMISTDASGQGSLVYGKTSDHVLALHTVLYNAEIFETKPIDIELAKSIAQNESVQGEIYQQIISSCVSKRDEILAKFPRLNRFLTGYDLEHAYLEDKNQIDAGRLITGAEGSLGFIAKARLNITKIPKFTTLVNIKYDDFESALRHAPSMIEAKATSVETVDSKVLNLARADIVWHSVSSLIADVPNKTMNGLNMVEYNSESESEITAKINQLSKRLDTEIQEGKKGVIGYQIISDKADIKKIYAMRKKAVGLLGKTKGNKKPIAFAEDTAVPPENLADFIMEFRALLDSHKLDYGMFGHVDAGVLHVRPALDLCDPEQELLLKQISDQVVALVAKYGGLMWGEHGKGYRSEYAPAFFGDSLYTELRKIKKVFDPYNQMNPGKICTPYESEAKLVQVDGVKRATYDRQIPISYKKEFEPAMSCNGNGLCFNYDTSSPMCPSSKISQDRRYSPKGRAGLIREWLLQVHKSGKNIHSSHYSSFHTPILQKLYINLFAKKQNADDYSHEVFDAMNTCLACKSCSKQCPVGVDVPDFRAKFLSIYYSRYRRPIKDYFVANVETLAPLMASFPRFFNFFISLKPSAWFLHKGLGYVDTPSLSVPRIEKRLSPYTMVLNSKSELAKLKTAARASDNKDYVLIVQDPFTSCYDAELIEKLALFIHKLKKQAVLLPFSPNGKPQHVKGFLDRFEKTAQTTASFLSEVSQLGLPMIGADASLVLCYRDEYQKTLGPSASNFKVHTISEWLSENADGLNNLSLDSKPKKVYKLLAHCSEKTSIPETENTWQKLFKHFDLMLDIIPVGCCGMAGTFGHESEHLESSKGIYRLSWAVYAGQDKRASQDKRADQEKNIQEDKTLITENADTCVLATGYSCRSQVKRFEGYRPQHPIEILADLLE